MELGLNVELEAVASCTSNLLPASFLEFFFFYLRYWSFWKPKFVIILECEFTFQIGHSECQKRGIRNNLEVQEITTKI